MRNCLCRPISSLPSSLPSLLYQISSSSITTTPFWAVHKSPSPCNSLAEPPRNEVGRCYNLWNLHWGKCSHCTRMHLSEDAGERSVNTCVIWLKQGVRVYCLQEISFGAQFLLMQSLTLEPPASVQTLHSPTSRMHLRYMRERFQQVKKSSREWAAFRFKSLKEAWIKKASFGGRGGCNTYQACRWRNATAQRAWVFLTQRWDGEEGNASQERKGDGFHDDGNSWPNEKESLLK